MVEPDYQDCLDDRADLRAAFHAAISLFHMSDWVWETHEATVRANFSLTDRKSGVVKAPDKSEEFANALEEQYPDFGLIRGIANAAKHLKLKPHGIRPVPNAPRHAANTSVQIEGGGAGYEVGPGGYGQGNWGYAGRPCVVLEGATDTEFSDIAKAVYQMWQTLRATHGW